MIDFVLDNNLDIKIVDNEIISEKTGETTLISAFFTDERVENARGYWLDVKSSELWTYEQSRLTSETARELTESAKEIAKKLVDDDLYKRIDVFVSISETIMTLNVKCYNDTDQIIIDKKFAI